MNDIRKEFIERQREMRLTRLAVQISDALGSRGIDACNGDCSEGFCRVVIFHGQTPDQDARDIVDNGTGYEESLIYEGRQILHARRCLAEIDDSDDASDLLAQFRTAQDRDTWL